MGERSAMTIMCMHARPQKHKHTFTNIAQYTQKTGGAFRLAGSLRETPHGSVTSGGNIIVLLYVCRSFVLCAQFSCSHCSLNDLS